MQSTDILRPDILIYMEISISDELSSIINFSREEAMRTGSYGIAPDHLFLGIIRHRENTAVDALRGTMVDIDEMKQFIDEKIFIISYSMEKSRF